ncbi:hypothetical protein [Bacillus sp. UMB0728]|uniref:hypothetical protein n=1 Tax=Bacillus sp. UMB0728 TaxID=2066052 RepID=UPI000C762839|nr:hypothetical protein [Bacillus sp. UMB0728]PLR72309.1 hypothetical protein CYJ37_12190 [Bacillus sp. UMB0728]
MANSVVRLDKLKSVYGGHIFSVRAAEEMQNGFVAHLGNLEDGEREVYAIDKPATATIAEKGLVLIANPAINYDERLRSEQDYKIEAGEAVRAYELNERDIFSVTKEGLSLIGADAVKGNYVVAQNGSFKLKEVATLTGDEAFVGKIVRQDQIGTSTIAASGRILTYVVIEVVKNKN